MRKIRYSVHKAFFCALYLLCASFVTLSAQPNGAQYISLDSWLYEGLDSLYQEEGKVIAFTTRPYTVNEYRYLLANLDTRSLSSSGKATLAHIQQVLPPSVVDPNDAAFSYSVVLSPELYYNTNKDLIWDNASQHYLNKYAYGYIDRKPLLSLPLQFNIGDTFFTEIDMDIKEQPGIGLYPVATFTQPGSGEPYVNWNNIPMGMDHIFHHFPDRYYLSNAKEHWNFYLGSGEYSVGTGRTGNLLLSKDADAIPAVRLSWYNQHFKYNFAYLSLNPGLGNSGAYTGDGSFSGMNLDLADLTAGYNSDVYKSDDPAKTDPFDGFMDTGLYPYKGYLIHSMEFRFLQERLYAAVTEAAVYARAVPELFTFMPLAFWHNGNNGEQTNSLLSVDLQVALGSWGQLYASGVMDQFTMSHEDDSTDPPANGFLVGGISRLPYQKGYISIGAEYVYTSDWLYTHKYWLETPTVTQRNTAITRGGYSVRMLGYSQGNDYQLIHTEIGYSRPGLYALTASYNYGIKGPYDIFMRLPQKSGDTIIDPTGDRKTWPDALQHQIGLVGTYSINNALDVGLHMYYTHITNYKNQAGSSMDNLECTLRARYAIGKM